jgi:glycosyltransferase involved in cell wall biosynthesis
VHEVSTVRVLHVLNHTARLNGHVHAAVDLACAQARLGHEVAVCSGGGDFDSLLATNHVEHFVIDQRRKPSTAAKASLSIGLLLRRWRCDVAHAHMMTSALLSWPGCQLNRVPLVTTVHNEFEKSAILMGIGTRVITVSAAVARSMRKRGIPARRLRVILNGTIGCARHEGLERTAVRTGSPSVLFVGGLHPRKGVTDLLKAFAQVQREVPAARLTIVGEGPAFEAYIQEANKLGCIDSVTFIGGTDNPIPYLLGADVFVLPSHADPAPLVLSEAREAGLAIIATNVDGIPELLENGKAGILVPAQDPAQLASAISTLLKDPAQLALWRANSQYNIARLSIARVACDTIEVYSECVRDTSARIAAGSIAQNGDINR